jgi:hypothetical protein
MTPITLTTPQQRTDQPTSTRPEHCLISRELWAEIMKELPPVGSAAAIKLLLAAPITWERDLEAAEREQAE